MYYIYYIIFKNKINKNIIIIKQKKTNKQRNLSDKQQPNTENKMLYRYIKRQLRLT